MRNCRKCKSIVPEDAKSCPQCGTFYIEETVLCPYCATENDLDATACSSCGKPLFAEDAPPAHVATDDIFDTSQMDSLAQQVADQFSLTFEERLHEEHHKSLHGAYIDRFFKSDFRTSADSRIQQLAEEIHDISGEKKEVKKQRNAILLPAFEELIDYFIIRYCDDLNETHLPEAILKYQGLSKEQIDVGQMIFDYLELEKEDETVFFDFVSMPAKKLKNTADSFLHPKKGETIHFICDLSILGTCKEGFAMTDQCVYWKMPLEKKQRVYYSKLKKIKREEDWITINGIFFSANKSLDIKLLRLLKRMLYW